MNRVILAGRITKDVVIENIEFAESKASQSSNTGYQQPGASTNGGGTQFMDIPDGIIDELPFS